MAFRNRKIKKWKNQDVLDWIKTIGLSSKWEADMLEAVEQSGCTGQDWFAVKSGKDIQNSFDIKQPMLANRVYREFKKIKDTQVKQVAIAAADNLGAAAIIPKEPKGSTEKSFELQIFGQSKYWKIKQKVTANTTIKQVKELYKAESGVGTAVEDIVLLGKSKELPNHKRLGDVGIKDEHHLLTVKFKAHGGMAQLADSDDDDSDDEDRERVIHFQKHGLTQSSKPDCLIGYDDDDGIDRAEIGCQGKHAMAADTMFSYIVQCLEKNIKAVTVPCPHCKTVLDWDKCTQIADMSGKEYAQWTRVIEERLQPETKTCPHCNAGCQRKQGVIIFRMNCSACRGPDWCWNCMQPWKGNGLIYCSNASCSLIMEVNQALANAPLITPEYLKNVKIPKTRACPMCLTFMEHKDRCKHMTCVGCTGEFCFVCLGKKDKKTGKWACNKYDFECKAAPVQKFE